MKIKVIGFLITYLFSSVNFAQNSTRTNIWYFGRNAGINFNTATPTPLTDGALNIWEGCATICDSSGQLLIYTDGIKIWNKNHQIIPGASNLGGDNSATQSGIIVPMPGTPNLLYVFSVDAQGGSGGLRYAIVDINLNGGLGGLVSSNNVLLPRSTEKITAVLHCNKTDFWIIGHELNNNNFDIWKLTSTGLSSSPQVISVGTPHGSTGLDAIGYLKGSPDGSKLALAVYGDSFFEVFNFDNVTGNITNPVPLTSNQFQNPYGVEFSPDSKLLYVAGTQNSPILFQYDLSLPTAQELQNSLTIVGKATSSYFGSIQLAPDGKIYIAKDNSSYLSVINHPNNLDTGCSFNEDNFYLAGKSSGLGLPNLIPSYFEQNVIVSIVEKNDYCSGTAKLTAVTNAKNNKMEYEWYLGGSLISNHNSDTITVLTSGNYKARVLLYSDCQSAPSVYEQTLNVEVQKHYVVSSVDAVTCQGQIYEGYSISGTYIDTFKTSQGCDSIRTLNLTIKPNSISTINQNICQGQTFLGYSATGTYTDTFKSVNGCDSIRTLNLIVKSKSLSTINQTICEGQSYLGYNLEGTFIDTFSATNGCDSIRTLHLTILKKTVAALGKDKEICRGDSTVLSAGQFLTYLWQDGSTNSSIIVYQAGMYSVTVTDACGSSKDEVLFTEKSCDIYFPSAFTPNNDGRNDVFKVLNGFSFKDYDLTIYNRWGQKIFETKDYLKGWDGKFSGVEQGAGVYVWLCKFERNGLRKEQKGTITLLR